MTSFPALWAIAFAARIVGAAVCWGLMSLCEKHGKSASPWNKLHLLFINIEYLLGHDSAGGFGPFTLVWTVGFVGATSALVALIPYGICRWPGSA